MKSFYPGFTDYLLPPAVCLFQLPALALAGGISLIARFIINTENELAVRRAAAAKKTN